jgi:hypothetical protein
MRYKRYLNEQTLSVEYKKDDFLFMKPNDILWSSGKGSIVKVIRAYKNGMITISGGFKGGQTQGRSGKLASGKGYSGETKTKLINKIKIDPKDYELIYIGNANDKDIMTKIRPYQRG